MLKDADFKLLYTSGDDDEPSDFLFEGLTNSIRFDLALGYFRSTGFSSLALGFASFIQRGGSMRFIINDSLAEKDRAAILKGLQESSDEAYERNLLEELTTITATLTKRNRHFFDCLSWLISSGRLQMIAILPAKNKIGIVHHKFGVFTDKSGDQAAFSGSLNFSQYALQYNVENIWCEYSWKTESSTRERIDKMLQLFEKTWNGESTAVRIIPLEQVKTAIQHKFPKKTIKELIETECKLAKEVMEDASTSEAFKQKLSKIIQRLEEQKNNTEQQQIQEAPLNNKWKHQDEAIALFLKEERGVLNMATGTGKTKTSLRICQQLLDQHNLDTIIVTCDGNDLLDQWYNGLLDLAQRHKWLIWRHYNNHHQSEKFRNNPRKKIMLIARQQLHLVLNNLSSEVAQRTLLIHDEVHKLGSAGNREKLGGLSEHIRYRLGLSATPEREYDEEGTRFIFDHIGPIIFSFGLEDGIRRGILSPFNYFPVSYELTIEDRARLRAVYSRQAAAEKAGNPMSNEDFWNELARVYKTAEGKIPAFTEFIGNNPGMLQRCIVFVETREYGEEILDIIHRHHTDFHTYYGGEDPGILTGFAKGEIECLLTCHRLSEGIDIQSLQNVILLSSAKARLETIQRIGRCLRADPTNPCKIANVVDFIRINNDDEDDLNTDQEREQFLAQLATIRPEQP